MSLSVAFRVDATSQIGTGHFMRCLALADQLKREGAQVCFVSRGLLSHLRDMVLARDVKFYALNISNEMESSDTLSHSHWLGSSQVQDALDCSEALVGCRLDWMVVDHYALDQHWETAMRKITKKIMVIDDLADREHDCDVLLDQNFYADMQTRYIGKVPSHCQMLLGPRYALLREEFRLMREKTKPRKGEVKKVLVFLGGVDADNYTSLAIEALFEIDRLLHVDVVIGAQHPFRAQIQNICGDYGYTCHVQTSQMAELMAQADLAIGAGGTATWERCCLGLPTMVLITAGNQQKLVSDAAEAGLIYAPLSKCELVDILRRHITTLFESPTLLKHISKVSMEMVDGIGSYRVSSALHIGSLIMRRVHEENSRELFFWRNHPSVRAVSRDIRLINWESHCSWLSEVISDVNREMLIGYDDDCPVGVVRFDVHQDYAEISIYLVPEAPLRGRGSNLLISAENWLLSNRPDIKKIRAEVLDENASSRNMFLRCGYHAINIHYMKELKGKNEPSN